jgi:hypothetical protein
MGAKELMEKARASKGEAAVKFPGFHCTEDFIVGVVVSMERQEPYAKPGGELQWVLVIDTEEAVSRKTPVTKGNYRVYCSQAILNRAITTKRIHVGDLVAIRYAGDVPSKSGKNPAKNFALEVDYRGTPFEERDQGGQLTAQEKAEREADIWRAEEQIDF